MLKVVFFDVFPYVIDKKEIFNYLWKNALTNEEYTKIIESEKGAELVKADLLIEDTQKELSELLDNNELLINEIINKYKENYDKKVSNFFSNYKFNEIVEKFLDDAKTADCSVILMEYNDQFHEYLKLLKLPKNGYTWCSYNNVSINNFEDVLTEKSIALNEFVYITEDESLLNQLLEKGYFCATINHNIKNSDGLHVFSSIDELSFGNLAFGFYDHEESEDGGI